MPELPDVEAMRRYLEATSLHQEIEGVEVRSAQMLQCTGDEELEDELVGRSFASTRRYGKYLFVSLDGGEEGAFLVLHFGMTGGLKYFKGMDEDPEYDRVLFKFANGYQLAYYAMRKLGRVDVIDDVEEFVRRKDLGPDALDSDFDLAAFKELVEGRRVMAKALLMDQGTIAGIGNVYADEILFRARVHPRTKMSSLDEETREALFHAMKGVLQTAVDCQAKPARLPDTFIRTHRHDEGRCPRCGTELETVKVSSRTAYFCPVCQVKRP